MKLIQNDGTITSECLVLCKLILHFRVDYVQYS